MTERRNRKLAWMFFGVFAIYLRGMPGWQDLLAGAPSTEWLAAIVLPPCGECWPYSGFSASGLETNQPNAMAFTVYQWGMIATFVAIPITGLVFIAMGYDFLEVATDIVGAPLALMLWLYVNRRL